MGKMAADSEGASVLVACNKQEGTYQRKIAPVMHGSITGARQELWLARAMAAPLSALTRGSPTSETMRNELMSIGMLPCDSVWEVCVSLYVCGCWSNVMVGSVHADQAPQPHLLLCQIDRITT
jgi:hypothetical protein